MPSSRIGTRSTWMIMPDSPLALISQDEHVRPAAPMSCMPTTAPLAMASSVASSSSFSVNGSPTCTLGRFASLSSLISSDANVAP